MTKARAPWSTEATAAFGFLQGELGFRVMAASDGPRESYVTFESDRARVAVAMDSPPAVLVTVLDRATGEAFTLPVLVRASSPAEQARLAPGPPLAEQLRAHAELLGRCAADLLAGDTSRRDRLRRVRADLVREQNKARFGTSTGESPRFDAPPSLEALFAGTDNDRVRDARAYQALWDYGYTLDDVAAFLGVSAGEVQAMLDRWDDL